MSSRFADVGGLERLTVVAPPRPPVGTVTVPGSKSLTNRALLLAALADGRSTLTGALDAEDTRLMVAALRRLGVGVEVRDEATTLVVDGLGGPPAAVADPDRPLEVGTAGTVARFLAAVLGASPGLVTHLDGSARMRERPMGQLFEALRTQGARVDAAGGGLLPATVHGATPPGGEVVVEHPVSSQIVSAVVVAALLAEEATVVRLPHGTPARPYVDMTLATIEEFGGSAAWVADDAIEVTPRRLRATDHRVEPDASAATYPLALAAVHGGEVTVPGLDRGAQQGDVGFVDVLGEMGATVDVTRGGLRAAGTGGLVGVDVDLTSMPDPGLTVAALAVHAEGPTRIRGVEVHRHHETDRIAAAATEARRLGARVVEHDDGLRIEPPTDRARGVVVRTYLDHRMAMAFGLLGDLVVDDPGCVAKTWPTYFAMLERFGMVAD